MDPLAAALLGAVLGALGASVTVVTILQRRAAQPVAESAPLLARQVRDIVSHLRGGAVVLGPHDEILAESMAARALGLVQGTRIAIPAVLDLARRVRREGELGTVNVESSRGVGPSHQLAVRVVALDEGTVLVLADDRSPALRTDETTRDFVTNVTHELKTPIGAIMLLAEALEEAADDKDAVLRFSGRMHDEAARLNTLISQIISLSRLQSADPMLAADLVDIEVIVDLATDRLRTLAQSRAVSLITTGEPDCWVLGDAEQLRVAIANLVQNAIAYSPDGARVVVSYRNSGEGDDRRVEISVADNGIGIATADLDRIFERFYRVDYGRSRASGGTGLGLSIVKYIVEAHRGTINVWSQPGQGSTFTVTLPAAPVATVDAEEWDKETA